MRLTGGGGLPSRRRTTSQSGAATVTYSLRSALLSPAALWAFIGATIVVLLFSFGVSLHGKDAPTAKVQPLRLRRLQGGGGLQSLLSSGRTVGAAEADTRFGSIYHDQLLGKFKLDQGRAGGLAQELVSTLKEMESPDGAALTGVLFSSPWSWFELEQGAIRFDYLDWVAEAACSNTGLKVAFLLDVVRAPAWVFAKWPDARAADSHGRKYELLSWFHEEARKQALQVVAEVTKHLVETHRDCVVAVQPVFNNEYEARYTQEHDCYQDYSAPALSAFRGWLRSRRPRIEDLNMRWGTTFASWEELTPPVLEAGSFPGVDMSPRYWDFLRWREQAGADVFNSACAAVQAAGALCFHHVPEFFTVLDAVYSGGSMLKHIASSPHTDFLIIDSGLRTPYGTVMNPTKLRMFVGAAVSYGKPVHFEAAVRQDSGGSSNAAYELLGSASRNALMAGARGLGVTGWLGKLQPDAQLAAALQPSPVECRGSGELVGVFIHIDSCMAWHGLQWQSARKDPLHDFVQDLADTLSARCTTDLVVHVELERFAADLLGSSTGGAGSSRSGGRRFDRVVFVEPLVLTAKELDTYALVKAAVASLPPSRAVVMRLPANNTAGVQLQVHEEL